MPFHFWELGDAYSAFVQHDKTVYAPEVLAYFAANGYGAFEWVDHLRWIRKPMLVVAGATTARARSRGHRRSTTRSRAPSSS